MLDLHLPFKLYANCFIVKGAMRSTICDLQNQDIRLIPNDLAEILLENQGKSISLVLDNYDLDSRDILLDYFKFLYDEDLIFFTEFPQQFPNLTLDYKKPFPITHAIIDCKEFVGYDFEEIFKKLDHLFCKFIQVRFYTYTSLQEITQMVSILDLLKSIITSVEIVVPYQSNFETTMVQELLANFPRITSIRISGSPEDKIEKPTEKKTGFVVFSKKPFHNCLDCGVISREYFVSNIETFEESAKYNSCLNGKIAIDSNGKLKNCPSMKTHFGNFLSSDVEKIINGQDFLKMWNITKDEITTCKDCEFRRVCTDCRAYIEDPDDICSKPLKCGYDPYTNKWEDWTQNPLKNKVMEYYQSLPE